MAETIYTVTIVTLNPDGVPEINTTACRTREMAEKISMEKYAAIKEFLDMQKDLTRGFVVIEPDKTFYARFETRGIPTTYSIIQEHEICEDNTIRKQSLNKRIWTRKNK